MDFFMIFMIYCFLFAFLLSILNSKSYEIQSTYTNRHTIESNIYYYLFDLFSFKKKNILILNQKFNICFDFVCCVRLCFTKLKLLLLAIEIKGTEEGNDSKISINPRGAKIQANTQGFFIAQSADEVKRYTFFCTVFSISLTKFIHFMLETSSLIAKYQFQRSIISVRGSIARPATMTLKMKR